MTREEFYEFLMEELERLEDERIIKLILFGRYQEAEEILLFCEIDVFNEYINQPKFKKLRWKEIPDEYKLLFVIYLFGARTDETLVVDSKEEMLQWLETSKKHRRLCASILKKLSNCYLFEFDGKLEELME